MKIDEPAELLPRPTSLLVVATIAAVTTTALATRMPRAMQNFQSMFKDLGVEPGRSAEWVFSLREIWWLFALASIALWIWLAKRSQVTAAEKSKMKMALIVTVALTALMYGFAAFAIYTPLFRLGATV
jgi:hypothetical protein